MEMIRKKFGSFGYQIYKSDETSTRPWLEQHPELGSDVIIVVSACEIRPTFHATTYAESML
jgi:hypothetical protein